MIALLLEAGCAVVAAGVLGYMIGENRERARNRVVTLAALDESIDHMRCATPDLRGGDDGR